LCKQLLYACVYKLRGLALLLKIEPCKGLPLALASQMKSPQGAHRAQPLLLFAEIQVGATGLKKSVSARAFRDKHEHQA